jgi:hypothetical protein
MNGLSAQTKTAPEGDAFGYLLYNYYFFRLATPIKPKKPEDPPSLLLPTKTFHVFINSHHSAEAQHPNIKLIEPDSAGRPS